MDFPISVPSIGLVDGKFADEDPLAGTPGSLIPAQWGNGITLEVLNVIQAAGIAPSEVVNNQLLQALNSMIQLAKGHGQCRLAVAGPTSLKLSPYNGNNLVINGVPQQIPAAGVTISNAGLAASTLYYVYAFMSGGAPVLGLSTTGHVTGSNGVEVMIGSVASTLVGMIRTNSASQFVNSQQQRFCLNWFNRQNIGASSGFAASRSTTSTTMVEISSSERTEFLAWGNEASQFSSPVNVFLNTAGAVNTAFYIDGSSYATAFASATSGQAVFITPQVPITFGADGYHFLSVYGFAPAGYTATWSLSSTVLTAIIRG